MNINNFIFCSKRFLSILNSEISKRKKISNTNKLSRREIMTKIIDYLNQWDDLKLVYPQFHTILWYFVCQYLAYVL